MSPSYRTAARAVRELHRLTVAARDESPEADAIRDSSDAAWHALSEVEQNRLGGLSEDLYSISDPPSGGNGAIDPQAQARLNDAYEARQRGDWDRALELLRRWGKQLSPALIGFLRGTIWREAGDPETAVLFLEHAASLEPDNGNFVTEFLTALDAADPPEARRRADEILSEPERYPSTAVVRSAHILLSAAGLPLRPEIARRLIPILESSLMRIERGDESGVDRRSYVSALSLLGVCHEAVGDPQAAVTSYSRALQADPNDHALLLARGVLRYGSSPQAISDLELAIKNGSPVFLPYYLLAHHYVRSGRVQDCLAMCDQALRMSAPRSLHSELAEWMAIAQAGIGFPGGIVEASFESATRLDPSNERARRNLAIFQSSSPPQSWEIRSEPLVRATGQAEQGFSMAA